PVQPLEMHRVDGVLLALEPVARNLGEDDLDEAVPPRERLPGRDEGRRKGPQVGPQKPGLGLHRIGLETDLVLEPRYGMRYRLEWLLDPPARVVPPPAVIVTAQPAGFDPAVRQVGATMRAVAVDQAVLTRAVPVQHEIFPENSHGLHRGLLEVGDGRD